MASPMHGVMAAVLHLRDLAEILPDSAIPFLLLGYGVRKPPQGMTSTLTPAADIGTTRAANDGRAKRQLSQQP